MNEVQATYHGAFDELHCVSPPLSAEVREVEVSLNAQQFTTSGVTFEHYAPIACVASCCRAAGRAAAGRR